MLLSGTGMYYQASCPILYANLILYDTITYSSCKIGHRCAGMYGFCSITKQGGDLGGILRSFRAPVVQQWH